jgi:hypothetical protein
MPASLARRILKPGQTVTIDLDLKPATYHAICG